MTLNELIDKLIEIHLDNPSAKVCIRDLTEHNKLISIEVDDVKHSSYNNTVTIS